MSPFGDDAVLRFKILPPHKSWLDDSLHVIDRFVRDYNRVKLEPLEERYHILRDLVRFVIKPDTDPIKTAGIRFKIENGVVFLKPANAKAPDRIELRFHEPYWHGELDETKTCLNKGFADRVLNQLQQLGFHGWGPQHFVLNEVHHGWYAISLKATLNPPANMPLFYAWLDERISSDNAVEDATV